MHLRRVHVWALESLRLQEELQGRPVPSAGDLRTAPSLPLPLPPGFHCPPGRTPSPGKGQSQPSPRCCLRSQPVSTDSPHTVPCRSRAHTGCGRRPGRRAGGAEQARSPSFSHGKAGTVIMATETTMCTNLKVLLRDKGR